MGLAIVTNYQYATAPLKNLNPVLGATCWRGSGEVVPWKWEAGGGGHWNYGMDMYFEMGSRK